MMLRGTAHTMMVFEGIGGKYEIAADSWAEMLLFLEDSGWPPEQLRSHYLSSQVRVSDNDARNIAAVGQRIADEIMTHPENDYPLKFDLGKFIELVVFCRAGGFRGVI